MSDASGTVAAETQWRLRDEREFLVRSLDDAEREHEAGDLSDGDYRLLRRRDEQRLADVDAALASFDASAGSAPAGSPDADAVPAGTVTPGTSTAGTTTPGTSTPGTPSVRTGKLRRRQPPPGLEAPARSSRRRRRRWLAVGGVACVAAAAVVLVVELTSPRLPGEAATGSVDLNTAQKIEHQLAQAQALVNDNQPGQALQLYATVLTEDPKDPVALAEWGWLDWEAATAAKQVTVAAEGASAEAEAVRLDGSLFAAQYYLATILDQEGQATLALAHYAAFVADHPTAKWLDDAAPTVRDAYAVAGKPPPAGLPAATTTPTTAG